MATFTWEAGNLGIYRYGRFEDYGFRDDSPPPEGAPWPSDFEAFADYEGDRFFEEDEMPASLSFTISGVTSVLIEEGDRAGDYTPISGTLDTIKYFNLSGDLILTIEDANVPMVWLASLYNGEENRADRIFDFIQGRDNVYEGSDNGDPSTWDDYVDTDDIETGSGDDIVRANGGNDYIKDNGGSDVYRGGDGYDILTYDEWFYNPEGMISGIDADLRARTITGPDGEEDTVIGIEAVLGTWQDDSIKGNSQNNFFRGYQGDDFFDGRNGFDTVDYSRDYRYGAVDGAKVFLNNNTGKDGFGTTDTYANIEGVRGTDLRDKIRDNDENNYIRGNGGNDRIIIGLGDDDMEGNEGADEFKFLSNNFGDNYIEDFNPDEGDFIVIKNARNFSDLSFEQDGDGVLLEYGTASIYLDNFDLANISSDDFIV